MSNSNELTTTSTIDAAIAGGKGAALSYVDGVHSAVYLQATREVANRISTAPGIKDEPIKAAVEAMVPIMGASAGAAIGNDFLVAGSKRAAVATGVVHGDAVLAPVKSLIGDLFKPLEDAARKTAKEEANK